jgi:hypothetical protein
VKDSVGRWEFLLSIEEGQFYGGSGSTPSIKPSLLIILSCYYPKIDKGPLFENNHLFKLPFSIHMDTKKISLPVVRDRIMNYGLPWDMLSLEDVVSYYGSGNGDDSDGDGEKVHPNFIEGALLLETWISNI